MSDGFSFSDEKTEDARPGQSGGDWIAAGEYELEVDTCTKRLSRKSGKKLYIVNFKIITSTNPARPVGSKTSWCATIPHPGADHYNLVIWDIKSFIAHTLGRTGEDEIKKVESKDMDFTAVSLQPLHGKRVHANVSDIKNKDGGVFTKADWALSVLTQAAA